MWKGTTPTFIFTLVTNLDLSTVTECWTTIKDSAGTLHNWTLSDVIIDPAEKTVSLSLTQSEINNFATGLAQCQIRLLFSDGKAVATKIGIIEINDTLKSGVIS